MPEEPTGRGRTLNRDDEEPPSSPLASEEEEHPRTWRKRLTGSLNFYRIHLIFFTFTPIIASGIFYASNGEIHIDYIDCLFNCVSAMCVCGLASSNLSTLTGWQQTILFILMLCGSPVSVSLIMISVRRHFFRTKFKHIIAEQRRRKHSLEAGTGRLRRFSLFSGPTQAGTTPQSSATAFDDPRNHPDPSSTLLDKVKRLFTSPFTTSSASSNSSDSLEKEEARIRMQIENKDRKQREKEGKKVEREREKEREKNITGGVRTSMIRRVDGEVPMMINPSGQMGGLADEREETRAREEHEEEEERARSERHGGERVDSPVEVDSLSGTGSRDDSRSRPKRVDTDPASLRRSSERRNSDHDPLPRSKTIAFNPQQVNPPHQHTSDSASEIRNLARTATFEFGGNNDGTFGRRTNAHRGPNVERSATRRSEATGTVRGPTNSSFPRSSTIRTQHRPTKQSGFGGFPMPHEIIRSGIAAVFPQIEKRITRTLTVPQTATIASTRSGTGSIGPGKPVPYISFDAVVGRNSQFKDLSSEQLEELGGVEYRALKVLMWIVPSYLIFLQLAGWIIFWPYIGAKGRYNDVFESQPRFVPIGWFAAFQSVSAFSNTGMCLVDTSMIPFQEAYVMIVFMIFLIFAGNTAYPIWLRFTIWSISRISPATSRLHETCRFLLDHPRRCYIYLFPSHQTLFLLLIIVIMTATDWISFLVLDIGTPAIESLPVGDRIIAGFFQSAAVRAAGFAIVPLNSLAPAVKVLYTIMMYVSVYPIAMSVRATNVYEERSLGLFDDQEEGSDEEDAEEAIKAGEGKVAGWTRYLTFHARRQLAFDIWWLGLALWLVCIIERGAINNPDNESYFNIFAILFELVSAYGTVGLSLGVSYDNFSLSGAFKPLAKLVVCIVMVRGRHRGLPVAIDRAVMLPTELLQEESQITEERNELRRRRSGTLSFRDDSPLRRRRASQSFFPPSSQPTGDSAVADDDDAPSSPTKHHHQSTYQWPGSAGRGDQGGLTPVRESTTMSRAPSVVEKTEAEDSDELNDVKREQEEVRS
ncbi:cation transport protein-domain-containing protein [Mrakia frigida]|uniref:cation transport protein-domain-containing protein n=1 Tax=Mrakia frigida TaxID=29902 RepID=UPI003FCBEEF8